MTMTLPMGFQAGKTGGERIGYACGTEEEPKPTAEMIALLAAGCSSILVDEPGEERKALHTVVKLLRQGDSLVVTTIDQLSADREGLQRRIRERGAFLTVLG